jgi:hypothetical protein
LRQPDAVIADDHHEPAGCRGPELDRDHVAPPGWKSMFERIGYQLVQNQAARDRLVHGKFHFLDCQIKLGAGSRRPERVKHVQRQASRILRERHAGVILGLVKLFVNQSDSPDPRLAFLESVACRVDVELIELIELHVDHARNHLEVIFDPVMDFLQQDLAFSERCR